MRYKADRWSAAESDEKNREKSHAWRIRVHPCRTCRFLNPFLFARRAFTLVELIVVIVILGILMAIAVPAFMSMRDRGNDTSALSNLNVAYRTVAGFAAGSDIYAASPAVGGIQVDLHDEDRTAHLCTVSATGTSFCLAMNSLGQLETNSSFVSSRTVYRTWGRTIGAASCWLPTEEDGPGEICDAPTRALGGEGTKPTGGDPGDLGGAPLVEDTADTIPPVGFEGAPANIPNVGGSEVISRAAEETPFPSLGNAGPRGGLAADSDGNVYRFASSLDRVDVASQTATTVIPASSNAPQPTVGEDLPASEAMTSAWVYGMTWGGGRLWFIDHFANTGGKRFLRVYNPATERVATVAESANNGSMGVSMAYVPAEGAVYYHTDSRYAELWRTDVQSGETTTVTEPGGWDTIRVGYDHVTKRLLIGGYDASSVRGIASFDTQANTIERIAGGNNAAYYPSMGDIPTDAIVTEAATPFVTADGTILVVESGDVSEYQYGPQVGKTWVRELDRATGELTTLYTSLGETSTDPDRMKFTGVPTIGGDGYLYHYDWWGTTLERVSLLP